MKFKTVILALAALMTTNALASPDSKDPYERALWKDAVRNNLEFFDRNAWDEASGSYATDLDRQGRQTSDQRASVALGRMVYANALAPDELRDLPRARRAAAFILNHMTVRDGHGVRFLFSVDPQGKTKEDRPFTFVFEQSYPIAGLIALYQADPESANLLPTIREAARSFWSRFHDPAQGGLFYYYNTVSGNHADDQGQEHKSYQSTVYPVSSFLLALREADPANRAAYDAWIRELLAVATRHIVERDSSGKATGWLRERFSTDFAVDESYKMTEAGHITQLAWVLDVAADKGIFADPAQAANARADAIDLLRALVDHGGISPIGAVYDAFDRVTGRPWVDDLGRATSAWWSTLEAVIAFERFAERDHRLVDVSQGLKRAYFGYFFDHEFGGEVFRIDSKTGEVVDGTKGAAGKSGYHVLETYRYLFEI